MLGRSATQELLHFAHNSVSGPCSSKTGLGSIKTRSGLDTTQSQAPSRCKPILKSLVEWIRDLVLLLFYALPGTPKTCRVYRLMLVRMLLYGIEGLVFYALALTIMVGEQVKDPGVLVELTRLLLCHNTGRTEGNNRGRRSATSSWLNLISDVNQTYPKLSGVLDELIWPTENVSETDFPTSSTIFSSMSTPMNSTGDTTFSTMPTPMNSTLATILSTMFIPMNSTVDTPLPSTMSSMRDITTPTMASSLPRTAEFQGYRLGWCLEVFSLKTGISTLTCSSSLMGPVCILAVVIMCSITLGFLCAVRPAASKRAGERV